MSTKATAARIYEYGERRIPTDTLDVDPVNDSSSRAEKQCLPEVLTGRSNTMPVELLIGIDEASATSSSANRRAKTRTNDY